MKNSRALALVGLAGLLGGCVAVHAQQDKEYPRFMRRNDKGTRFFSYIDGSDEIVEDISSADFDVSCDGKHWFHFLGPRCYRNSPHWYKHHCVLLSERP